ncbi:hypothetical protein [Streptomyces luteogriseus]|uniref:hypothetical protein n=1 Tax=Streptomyces luteogriseus TaxID=68233 RepID=UPI002E36BD46|nr:hypothetical protein [Streptomyces luteogriseus]WTJ26653.1 hypothetical protein OID52_06040 [Streptomyces luteogriseus]
MAWPCSRTATGTERARSPPLARRTRELPAVKAFLTFRGAGHSNCFGDSRTVDTFVDWMRWSLYGDTAARDHLRADATAGTTTWESALS